MEISISLLQVVLAFVFVCAGAAVVFLGGGVWRRAVRRMHARWKEDAAHRQGLILLGASGDFRANRGAKALLGGFSGARPTMRSILDRIGDGRDGATDARTFKAALTELTMRGEPFEATIDTKAGKRLNVIGEPRGASIALTLHNITEIYADATDARARAKQSGEQAEMLNSLLVGANVIAGRLDKDGQLVWRSDALANLPKGARDALRRAARLSQASSTAPTTTSDVMVGEVSYALDVQPMTNGGLLFHASLVTSETGGEEAFRRFVNTMAETFAHLKVGLMIFDQERRLTLFNPATVGLFGGDAAWFARRPTITEILDGMREARAIPEQADFVAWRDRLLDQFEGDEASEYVDDWHLSDGRTIHIIARPHPSGGLAVTAEDISESIDLLRATAADKAVMLATTDFLEEALIVFGPDGLSKLANAAFLRLWDFSPEAFSQPMHVSDVARHCLSKGGGEAYWSMILDRVTTGVGRRKAIEKFSLLSGVIVQGRYSPMPDGSSLLVMFDITASETTAIALRQRNEALEHADEIRGALVDQISHQMRTPLNAVAGFGQLLADERFGALTDKQSVYVDGIVQSSAELLDAINGMTDLITVAADSMSLEGEVLNPANMLDEVLDLAIRRFGAEGVIADVHCDGLGETFRAHRIRLRQIIFNILVDALTKRCDGSAIEVRMSMVGRTLVIAAFHDPVENVNNGGLALSLVRRFTSLHDGSLEVSIAEDGRRHILCRLPECEIREGWEDAPELPLAVEV